MIVHHWAKERRADLGPSLRGSGDSWAFGDSYVFLARRKERLMLTAEHRSAPSFAPLPLRLLTGDGDCVHLEPADENSESQSEEVSASFPSPNRRKLSHRVPGIVTS